MPAMVVAMVAVELAEEAMEEVAPEAEATEEVAPEAVATVEAASVSSTRSTLGGTSNRGWPLWRLANCTTWQSICRCLDCTSRLWSCIPRPTCAWIAEDHPQSTSVSGA